MSRSHSPFIVFIVFCLFRLVALLVDQLSTTACASKGSKRYGWLRTVKSQYKNSYQSMLWRYIEIIFTFETHTLTQVFSVIFNRLFSSVIVLTCSFPVDSAFLGRIYSITLNNQRGWWQLIFKAKGKTNKQTKKKTTHKKTKKTKEKTNDKTSLPLKLLFLFSLQRLPDVIVINFYSSYN